MSIDAELLKRIQSIAASSTATVIPVGDVEDRDRGILRLAPNGPLGGLRHAVVNAFGIAAVAAALAAQPIPAHASGVGYDADVYGQAQGQVMRHGAAVRMEVVSVRPVQIEVAPSQQRRSSGLDYAIPAAAAGVGALIGNQIGGNSQNGRQIGAILGGLVGAGAGAFANHLNEERQGNKVAGTEITLMNPASKAVSVLTQAGEQRFAEGDKVLVVNAGSTTRVVLDPSQDRQQGQGRAGTERGIDARPGVFEVVRTASTLGLQVDPVKIGQLLQSGIMPDQRFGGKVVAVDKEAGLVYQDIGRGSGTVHLVGALSRLPGVGEVVRIRYQGGRGTIAGRTADHGLNR